MNPPIMISRKAFAPLPLSLAQINERGVYVEGPNYDAAALRYTFHELSKSFAQQLRQDMQRLEAAAVSVRKWARSLN